MQSLGEQVLGGWTRFAVMAAVAEVERGWHD